MTAVFEDIFGGAKFRATEPLTEVMKDLQLKQNITFLPENSTALPGRFPGVNSTDGRFILLNDTAKLDSTGQVINNYVRT